MHYSCIYILHTIAKVRAVRKRISCNLASLILVFIEDIVTIVYNVLYTCCRYLGCPNYNNNNNVNQDCECQYNYNYYVDLCITFILCYERYNLCNAWKGSHSGLEEVNYT